MTASALGVAGCAALPLGIGSDDAAKVVATTPAVEQVAPLMQRGDDAVARSDIASAVALYNRAHSANPTSPEPMRRLAAAELVLGQYSEAYQTYRALQAVASGDAEAAFRLGELQLMRGMPQAAIDQFNIVLKTRKDDPALYSAIGVAYSMLGKFDLAINAYQTGLKVSPDNLGLRNNLGLAQYFAGDREAAIKTFSGLVAMPNAKPRYRQTLAMIYLEKARTLAGTDADFAKIASELANFDAQKHPAAMGLADGRSLAHVFLNREAAIRELTTIIAADRKHDAVKQATTGQTVDDPAHIGAALVAAADPVPKGRFTVAPAEQLSALPAVKVTKESLPSLPTDAHSPPATTKVSPPAVPPPPVTPQSAPESSDEGTAAPLPAVPVAPAQTVTDEAQPVTDPQPKATTQPAPITPAVTMAPPSPAKLIASAQPAAAEGQVLARPQRQGAVRPAPVMPAITPSSVKPRIIPVGKSQIVIQVGAFANESTARELQQKLANLGSTHVTTVYVGGETLYRVRLGPMNSGDDANELLSRIGTELNQSKVESTIELRTMNGNAIYVPASAQGPGFILRSLTLRTPA
ncbi:MAG: tetratricopeptide repeat protein [Stellaceae bacterium]